MNKTSWILVIAWVVAISFFIYFYMRRKMKKNGKIEALFNKVYKYIIRVPIINTELVEIKKRLYENNLWQERTLRYKAMLYYITAWLSAIVCLVFVFVYFDRNYFQIFVLSIFCYYVKIIVLEYLIGDDTKLLS